MTIDENCKGHCNFIIYTSLLHHVYCLFRRKKEQSEQDPVQDEVEQKESTQKPIDDDEREQELRDTEKYAYQDPLIGFEEGDDGGRAEREREARGADKQAERERQRQEEEMRQQEEEERREQQTGSYEHHVGDAVFYHVGVP